MIGWTLAGLLAFAIIFWLTWMAKDVVGGWGKAIAGVLTIIVGVAFLYASLFGISFLIKAGI